MNDSNSTFYNGKNISNNNKAVSNYHQSLYGNDMVRALRTINANLKDVRDLLKESTSTIYAGTEFYEKHHLALNIISGIIDALDSRYTTSTFSDLDDSDTIEFE